MWNKQIVWAWGVLIVWVVAAQSSQEGGRLKEVKTKILDLVGNSSSSAESVEEVLNLLYTSTGRHLGKLMAEGVMLGVQEKDSLSLLMQFWGELQERLSPHLLEQLEDYRDFFRGLEFSTLPLVWEQMFKKDELGNSLAGMPLGQLVDMIQPTAARYGIDIRTFVNSLLGKGENNARDLVLEAVNTFEWSKLFAGIFNSTSSGAFLNSLMGDDDARDLVLAVLNNFDWIKILGNVLNSTSTSAEATDSKLQSIDTKLKVKESSGLRSAEKDKTKKSKNEKILRLFRPLVTSLLRENNIDLEADAVLEVLSPLLSGDVLAQILPLLSVFGGQGGKNDQKNKQGDIMAQLLPLLSAFGGQGSKKGQQKRGDMMAQLLPLLSAFGGQGSGKNKQKNEVGGIGNVLGALLGGDDNQMDIGKMINLASVFMNNDKTARNKGKMDENAIPREGLDTKRDETTKSKGALDMSTVLKMAGQLAEKNNINIGSVLEATEKILNPASAHSKNQNSNPRRNDEVLSSKVKKSASSPGLRMEDENSSKNKATDPAFIPRSDEPRHLIDILEPIISTMQKDKKCNRKLGELFKDVKTIWNKVAGLSLVQNLRPLLMAAGGDVNLIAILESLKYETMHQAWEKLLFSLKREEHRTLVVKIILNRATEIVVLLSTPQGQERVHDAATNLIQGFLSSYGQKGVTLDNFPERLAPLIGLLGKSLNLPFNPTTILVPLRRYIKDSIHSITAGLDGIKDLEYKEAERKVEEALEEMGYGLEGSRRATQDGNVACLKERICHLRRKHVISTPGDVVIRYASFFMASFPLVKRPDCNKLAIIIKGINDSTEQCTLRGTLPRECRTKDMWEEYDDESDMSLDYEHTEL